MLALCREELRSEPRPEAPEEVELRVREATNEFARDVMGAVIENRDDGASRIERDGQSWFRVAVTPKTIMTSLGPVTYRRARYRSGASGASPVPVDESLGLVDDYLTRPAAALGLLMMGHCTAREAAAFFAKTGAMTPSVSTLQRLTMSMHECWESLGPETLGSIREAEGIPQDATTASVSLDGVMVQLRPGEDGRAKASWREAACTGLAYGLRRVCAAWGMARSSFYAMTSGQHAEQPPAKRRGPKPAISDQALLVAIEADLEASPWEGEGYRKVWARLRVCRDIRVARKRVLRLMRENNLLSPHRCRRRGGNPHDGEIITHAPNLMWGTDGVRVFTVDDGWGWIFTAVEHWNAECVGWHVCKRGDRFAALQPISMGLAGLYGSTAAGAARGLALRMDHGSQYLSDHFTNQIKFWGIQPSYAFVAEPQTNGVAERFNRTLKEQIIHGRIYRNIAELRDAVRDFVELYNAQWIVEKNGYLSPAQARQAWHAAISIRPAA